MSEKFEIGEIAIIDVRLRNDNPARCYIGCEVEVVEGLRPARVEGGFGYRVRAQDGEELNACPRALRKERPPADLSSWREIERICGYRPQRASA